MDGNAEILFVGATWVLFLLAGYLLAARRRQKPGKQVVSKRELLHQTILERATDGILILQDDRIKWLNARMAEIMGYPQEEVLNTPLTDYLVPEYRVAIEERCRRRLRGESVPLRYETTIVHKEGYHVVIEVNAGLTEFEGAPAAIATIRDVTSNKRLEGKLQDAYEFLHAVINAVPDAIFVKDEEHRWIEFNDAFCKLVGREANDLRGKTDYDFLSVEEADIFWEQDEIAFASETPVINEEKFTNARGEERFLLTKKTACQLPSGQRVLAVISMDVTERRQTEEALRKAKEEAEAANRTKSQFLSNMTHELRTPMNGMLGMTSLLLDTKLDEEQLNLINTIRASGDTLLSVINEILDFSKIEANKLELEQVSFNLRSSVEEALDLVAPQATEKRLHLAYFVDDAVPDYITQDATRTRQVLANLLSNAVKFTEQGDVIVVISLLAQEAENCTLQFAVQDTGTGIPADRIDRLFQSFHQVDGSITRRYGGTGLGLAISKRLVELMGGTIWVESAEGEGTTFYFTIVARPDPTRQIEFAPTPGTLHNKRVLIVEENAATRRLLHQQLQGWGVEADIVSTLGKTQLSTAFEEFDALIVDLVTACTARPLLLDQIVRNYPHLPIVVLLPLDERLSKYRQRTNVAVVSKPIHASHLHDALVTVLYGQWVSTLRPSSSNAADAQMSQEHPLKILLAEDNVTNQRVALGMLAKYGYRADVVANGQEVLEALTLRSYEVIFMDVNMPEMDGLTATRRIRESAPHAPQPYIIAMTANAMQEDRKRCLDAGMNDYISKPVRMEDIGAALQRAWSNEEASASETANPPIPLRQQPTAASDSPIDETVLTNFAEELGEGGHAMVVHLIRLYLEDSPILIERLKSGLDQQNIESVHRAAHTLYPGSSHVGALRLAAMAQEMEMLCIANDLASVAAEMNPLLAEYERVRSYLTDKLHEQAAQPAEANAH